VFLHGNAKTDEELGLAVDERLGAVIVDSEEELDRLAALARAASVSQPILLRVTPDVTVATHEAIATGHADSKFGVPLAEAPAVVRRAAATAGVRLLGLHAHAGSQVLDAEAHVRVVRALLAVASEAKVQPAVLDVGGGFGVTYADESPTDPSVIAAALRGELDARGVNAAIEVEPGRAIVANPAVTLYRVLAKKRAGGRTLVAIDGGMSDNLRPALYDARHAVAAVRPGSGSAERVTVVGRHCESGDVVAHDVELPADLSRGDLLVVAATGAYTYPLSSAYNRFGRPAVIGVRDAVATEWIRRETSEDMDRLDVILGSPWDAGSAPIAEGGART
jgi:diaminopimelate decarboxylase